MDYKERKRKKDQESEDSNSPSWLPLLLVVGFILVFIGVFVVFAAALIGSDGSVSTGVVIFIGPIPIVFGAGPDAWLLICVGAVLAAVSVVLFIVLRRKPLGRAV